MIDEPDGVGIKFYGPFVDYRPCVGKTCLIANDNWSDRCKSCGIVCFV